MKGIAGPLKASGISAVIKRSLMLAIITKANVKPTPAPKANTIFCIKLYLYKTPNKANP